MPESFSPEISPATEPKKPLAQELFESLRTVDHRRNKYNSTEPYNARKQETQMLQARCLRTINDGFIDQSFAHLYSDYLANEKNYKHRVETARLRGETPPKEEPYDDVTALEGFINEYLVRNQIELTRPELITSERDPEKRKRIKALGDKLLEVAHQPDRFNLNIYGRNPDATWLNVTDDNRLIIDGVGEITAGRLSKRKYLQLGEQGYKQNLRNLSRQVNSLSNSSEHGLDDFGANGLQIEISPNYKQYVVLKRDSDTSPEGLSANIGPVLPDDRFSHLDQREQRKYFSTTEHDAFLKMLLDPNRTEILTSAFTHNEVRALAEIIIKKIKDKHPTYIQHSNSLPN